MTADGFLVAGFDGTAEHGGRFNALPAPFVLRGRRRTPGGADERRFRSSRSLKQSPPAISSLAGPSTVSDVRFGPYEERADMSLYVAIPREAAPKLDTALRAAGLTSARNVVRNPCSGNTAEGGGRAA